MKISVIDSLQKIVNFELDKESLLEDLKALIEVEMKVPFSDQVLLFNQKPIEGNKTLGEYGISEGDMLTVQNSKINSMMDAFKNFSSGQQSSPFGNLANLGGFGSFGNQQNNYINQQLRNEALQIKKHYKNSPNDLQYILHQNPELANAVLNDDLNVLINFIKKNKEKKLQEQQKELERARKFEQDPFNPEYQKIIAEELRMKKINQDMEYIQEHFPEFFGSVTMLYIDCALNGTPIQAFVDSGAQTTIMSKKCAEQCGLVDKIDQRFAGMAMGVGTSKILGKIHYAEMKIQDKFFPCSVTVMEDDKVDFLFGLDMLKGHQCKIDLKKNRLIFENAGIEVPFLPEGEIKRGFGIQKPKPNESSSLKSGGAQIGGFPEEDVKKLVDMGFSKDQAIGALRQCQGNVELAASLLFGQ